VLIENPLNESALAFPVLETIHIAAFACGVGAAALVNFRLLGVGLTQRSAVQLWKDMAPWTLTGLSVVTFSGLLLFSINPDVYYLNYTFLFKMASLVLATLLHYTLVRKAAASGAAWGRGIACVSFALWTLVLFGGVFIGLSATRPPAAAPPPAGVNFDDFLHR
jgi:hypothetical protein